MPRQTVVTVRFERKVSLNFQGWNFSTEFSETVEPVPDESLIKARRRLRLRAMASVYSDILGDMGRILKAVEGTNYEEQAKAVQREAESGVDDAVRQLKELSDAG